MEGQAREEDEGLDLGAKGSGAVVDLGSGAVADLDHGAEGSGAVVDLGSGTVAVLGHGTWGPPGRSWQM